MSNLKRVAVLFVFSVAVLPALAGAVSQRSAPRGGLVEVIVTLDGPPLARVAPARLLAASASASYLRTLATEQRVVEARLHDEVSEFSVRRRYSIVVNGFAAVVPRSELAKLDDADGVAQVYPSVAYHGLRSSTASMRATRTSSRAATGCREGSRRASARSRRGR